MKAKDLLQIMLNYQSKSSTQLFLVGGFIRDVLLGKDSIDLDFTFEGEIEALFELISGIIPKAVGSDYQTMRFESSDHFHFDIATFRRETYDLEKETYIYSPSTLKWDIARRDFTVNTAYVKYDEILCGHLSDYVDKRDNLDALKHYIGANLYASHPLFMTDLSSRRIRILQANSFYEDPSRVLRALKLKNQLDFTIEDQTQRHMLECIKLDRLSSLPLSRMQMELAKLFKTEHWHLNLEVLINTGWKAVGKQRPLKLIEGLNRDQHKRTVLMLSFYDHIEWLYGVDDQIKKCHREFNGTLELFCSSLEINDYNLYKLLYNKRIETLNLLCVKHSGLVGQFLGLQTRYKLRVRGNDLIRIGIPQNGQMRLMMDALLKYKIDHRIEMSLEDEIKYIESIKNEY